MQFSGSNKQKYDLFIELQSGSAYISGYSDSPVSQLACVMGRENHVTDTAWNELNDDVCTPIMFETATAEMNQQCPTGIDAMPTCASGAVEVKVLLCLEASITNSNPSYILG